MILINNEEEIKEFTKVLNEINQEIKNIYNMSSWVNKNGTFLACYQKQFPSLVSMTYNTNGFTKKREPLAKKVIEEYINPYCYMIDPKEYFAFYKDNKNNINEILIDEKNNSITFKTLVNDLKCFYDPKLIKKESIETGDLLSELETDENFAKTVLELGNSTFKMILDLDNDKVLINPEEITCESYLPVKLNKKFIVGLKNKYKKSKGEDVPDDISKVKIFLYETDEDTKFVMKIVVTNKNTEMTSYYGVTDY